MSRHPPPPPDERWSLRVASGRTPPTRRPPLAVFALLVLPLACRRDRRAQCESLKPVFLERARAVTAYALEGEPADRAASLRAGAERDIQHARGHFTEACARIPGDLDCIRSPQGDRDPACASFLTALAAAVYPPAPEAPPDTGPRVLRFLWGASGPSNGLTVYDDGTVRRTSEPGGVELHTGRVTPGRVNALRAFFLSPSWRALPPDPPGAQAPFTYMIEAGDKQVRRSDPASRNERVFVDALGQINAVLSEAMPGDRF